MHTANICLNQLDNIQHHFWCYNILSYTCSFLFLFLIWSLHIDINPLQYWFNCPNCSIGTDIVGWNSGNIMVNESSFWWGTEVIGKAFRVIYLFTGEDKVVIDIWGWRFFNYIKDRTFQTNLVALQLLNKWRWYLAMLNCKIIYCKTLIFCRQIK